MKRIFSAGLLALLCLAFMSVDHAVAADPATFDVGAGASNINPDTPQYPGGYGYKTGPFTTVHDPLEVRAFVVGKGSHAAAFVVADLVGWFSAYHGDNLSPYGIDKTRERIADVLNASGYSGITRSSVILSTTHTHAAPSVVGIWGTPDEAYLKKVADGAVAAVQQAVDSKKNSEIWTSTGNIRSLIWQNGQGTDHVDGFSVDDKLPIMWARDPQTGATNALYANVPVHPDQFNGKDQLAFSADWPGYARKKLGEMNGGTAVIAAGTLGRQETPGSINDYTEVVHQGEVVTNAIQRAMATATPLTSDTIAGAETAISSPADNEDLLTGMNLYNAPKGVCIDAFSICTIPRSIEAPYLTDSPADPHLGTNITGIRIGDVSYSTDPGEAFPEVNEAIRDSISGDRQANVVANAGDMLGYYYVRSDYTDQQFGSSDFEAFNVGPDLAQQNADAARENAATLGFGTTPTTVHATFDSNVEDKPGVQFYSDRIESANPVATFYGSSAKSQDGTALVAGQSIDWDMGDGTTFSKPDQTRFDHTFPGPGTYHVTASITAVNSKTRSWTQDVVVDPPLNVTASTGAGSKDGAPVSVAINSGSGQGTLVSAVWTCGGSTLYGLNVTCPNTSGGTASVTATDGAGNTATGSVEYASAPKLAIASVKISPKKPKAGKGNKLQFTVKNTGGSDSTSVKACAKTAKAPGSKASPGCRSLGTVAAGKSKVVKTTVKLGKKVKKKFQVKLTVTSSNAATVTTTKSYKPKPVKKKHHKKK